MARGKDEDLQKHTLNLRTGDIEQLALLFPRFPPSVVARQIISRFIDQTKKAAETGDQSLPPMSDDEIDY
jgi:hypothetical protein